MLPDVFPVPTARMSDLVTTKAGDDQLVYDQLTHHIHHLNATVSTVWRACDGRRNIPDLAGVTGLPIETVREALALLSTASLLAEPVGMPRQSRRSFLRKAGIAGAVAVPAIVSVSAPAGAGPVLSCTDPWESGEPCPQNASCCCTLRDGPHFGVCSGGSDNPILNYCDACTV